MKQMLTFILAAFALMASAQQKADIEVSYTEYSPSMSNGKKDDVTHKFHLLANASESKFFSPKTELLDSLNSTPEGEAKVKQMQRAAAQAGNYDDMPRPDGSYYVIRTNDTYTVYDRSGMDKWMYVEPIHAIDWTIGENSKEVLGYECIEASTDYHGRHWTVWFAPEIPVNAGPWKLFGLPGVILEASADDGTYRFVADGIQQTQCEIAPVYNADSYEKTDRDKFWKSKRSFFDNPVGSFNAAMGGKGISIGDVTGGPLFAPRETIDFIETDY